MPKVKKNVVDPKHKMSDFLEKELIPLISSQINCNMIGRVISYRKTDHRCSVQPLPLQSDGDKRAPLVECVVPSSIWQLDEVLGKLSKSWKPMKVGSVVSVDFCDREMDNWTGKSNYAIETKRVHSLQDTIIQAVIFP